MQFDEYQEVQQIWRYTAPTNTYVEYTDASTSGGIYKRDFFRECNVNVEMSIDVVGDTSVILYGELEDNTFIPLTTLTAVSGVNLFAYTISGLVFYTGLGFTFNTGVVGTVNWVYVGDATYATKDDGMLDGVWKYIRDITGRIEPISSTERMSYSQSFDTASDLDFIPYEYRTYVLAGDGIVDVDSIQRKVVGQPEWYKYELPHVVARLERTQFLVNT